MKIFFKILLTLVMFSFARLNLTMNKPEASQKNQVLIFDIPTYVNNQINNSLKNHITTSYVTSSETIIEKIPNEIWIPILILAIDSSNKEIIDTAIDIYDGVYKAELYMQQCLKNIRLTCKLFAFFKSDFIKAKPQLLKFYRDELRKKFLEYRENGLYPKNSIWIHDNFLNSNIAKFMFNPTDLRKNILNDVIVNTGKSFVIKGIFLLIFYNAPTNTKGNASLVQEILLLPLTIALLSKNKELIEILLTYNADKNLDDYDRNLNLIIAVDCGFIDLVKLFLTQGANINFQNHFNNTPIIMAAKKGNIAIAKLLLSQGADVNIQGKYGNTALIMASYKKKYTNKRRKEIVKLLLEYNANVNIKNQYQATALMSSIAKRQNYKIAKILINNKANVNTTTEYGITPLLLATEKGYLKTIKLLLNNKADVNAQDKNGNSVLIYAAMHNGTDITKLLLAHKANVNVQNKYGTTPLIAASWHGYSKEIIEILLAHGANANARNNAEKTALDLAKELQKTDIIQILENHINKNE